MAARLCQPYFISICQPCTTENVLVVGPQLNENFLKEGEIPLFKAEGKNSLFRDPRRNGRKMRGKNGF